MNKTDPMVLEEYQMDLENRIKNLLWTISGDYTLEVKPNIALFLRSNAIALYDGIKQGGLARFYDREFLSLYLVKKIFLGADEQALTRIAQLCIEEAVGEKLCKERPGIRGMQRQAFSDILEQEFEETPFPGDVMGWLKLVVLQDRLNGEARVMADRVGKFRDLVRQAGESESTMELVTVIDRLYNAMFEPHFPQNKGTLEQVLAVTLEDLTEFDWEDYLSEEMYEATLESYIEQVANRMTDLENEEVTEEMEEKRNAKFKVTVLPPEVLEKAHTYLEGIYSQ